MKLKFYAFLLMIFVGSVASAQINLNVSGTVFYNNLPMANVQVNVLQDSANLANPFSFYMLTDSNGFYHVSNILINTVLQGGFTVSILNCNGVMVKEHRYFSPSQVSFTVNLNYCATSTHSCISNFTFSGNGAAPSAVTFTNTSVGTGYSSYWSFGDGTSSTVQNPTHTYTNAGVYNVMLAITRNAGGVTCSDTIIKSITISPASNCVASFTYTHAPINLLEYTFTAQTATNTQTYTWDFGDNTTATSTTGTVNHQYAQGGVYVVCLTVTNFNGCSNTSCQTIQVSSPTGCQANYSSSNNTTNPLTVSFTNTSIGSFTSIKWVFGDGSDATVQNPTHTYAQSGTYTVCMVIKSNNTACNDSICKTITVTASTSNTFVIEGNISVNFPNLNIMVQLFRVNSANTFYLFDTTSVTSINGTYHYRFGAVPTNGVAYLILASVIPPSPTTANYLPTYFGNTTQWLKATVVRNVPGTNAQVCNISLISGSNSLTSTGGANGFVVRNTGGVIQGPAANVVVTLFFNGQPIATTTTDSNGFYQFLGLPVGTYTVVIEIPGVGCTPFTFTIGTTGFFARLNGTVKETTVEIQNVTGIASISDFKSVSVYPNPATDFIYVKAETVSNSSLNYTLMDVKGRVISEAKSSTASEVITIPVSRLSNGIYYLRLNAANSTKTTPVFINR